jgi:hypothetical protein
MRRKDPPDRDTPDLVDVDWESPRWRESDEVQGDVEQTHRLMDDRAPAQRGALDDSQSVGLDPAEGTEPRSGQTD